VMAALFPRMTAAWGRGLALTLAPVFADVARLLEIVVMLYRLDGSFLLIRSELVRGAWGLGLHTTGSFRIGETAA
jgi:hypothetical protein